MNDMDKKFTDIMNREREKINAALSDYFNSIIPSIRDKNMEKVVEELKRYTIEGGKRLRPIFVVQTFKMLGGTSEEIYKAAISFELSQSFFLIHDDIMDKSDLRRGKKSFHRRMEDLIGDIKEREHMGMSLAIVAGDLAVDYTYDALIRADFPLELKIKAIKEMTETIKVTGYGEGLDMLSSAGIKLKSNDLVRIHLRKTARYTIEGPMVMGAYLSGNENQIKLIRAYGNLAGLAFQLVDDIIGLYGTDEEIGKPAKSDVNEGKQTLLMIKAMEHDNGRFKNDIERILSSGNVTDEEFNYVRQIVIKTGSLEFSKRLVENLADSAKKYLAKIEGKEENKEFLMWLTDFLIKRKH
ncbi:polyprenyl synthetase family protein [Caldiplasma sukawensis]